MASPIVAPPTLTLHFRTLTPLYTGGVGQWGDQLHPSGLLGSIRHFSCAVARALGDGTFEPACWGLSGDSDYMPQAKGVSLRWDPSGLKPVSLPEKLFIREGDHISKWFFNQAFAGHLTLHLTRMNLSDFHWRILRAAIAIQSRHAMFGAKDQFGLGALVLENPEALAPETFVESDIQGSALRGRWTELPLTRYAFTKVRVQGPLATWQERLEAGLRLRARMRQALRQPGDGLNSATLTDLRHRMLGKLNRWGSAVDISAAYAVSPAWEVRIAVALRPDDKRHRQVIMKRFTEALGCRVSDWIFGPGFGNKRHALINQLAGW
ncbi:MAG: hypothetical protein D6819_09875 [Gammaproteobacteria bacterium]|nr:MAG: hypothetical protein D6819_09875 [Gammaproteobacteria bacterium]